MSSHCVRFINTIEGLTERMFIITSCNRMRSACLPTIERPICNIVVKNSTSCIELSELPQLALLQVAEGITGEWSRLFEGEGFVPLVLVITGNGILSKTGLSGILTTVLFHVWSFLVKTCGVFFSAEMVSPDGKTKHLSLTRHNAWCLSQLFGHFDMVGFLSLSFLMQTLVRWGSACTYTNSVLVVRTLTLDTFCGFGIVLIEVESTENTEVYLFHWFSKIHDKYLSCLFSWGLGY